MSQQDHGQLREAQAQGQRADLEQDHNRPTLLQTQSGYDVYAHFTNDVANTASNNSNGTGQVAPAAILQQQQQQAQAGSGSTDTTAFTAQEPSVPIPGTEHGRRDVPEVAQDKPMYPQQGDVSVPQQQQQQQQPQVRTSAIPVQSSRSDVTAASSSRPPHIPGLDAEKTTETKSQPADGRVPGLAVNSSSSSKEQTKPLPTTPKTNNQSSAAQNGSNPYPDLVLVFKLPAPDAPADEWRDAEREYTNLKSKLKDVGLVSIAKPGGKGRNERLLLVKAVQSAVRAEAQQERLSDFLGTFKSGGSASEEHSHEPRDFRTHPFFSAERSRHAGTILKRALYLSGVNGGFPRLAYYFPPHDPKFNSQLLSQWSQLNFIIPEDQLLQVRYHFGDAVALYFEFLRGYFLALAFPSFIGAVTWLGGYHFSRLYSVLLVIWSVAALELWKLREKQLAVRWGTYGLSKQERVRIGYKAETLVTSDITGRKIPYSPWYHRELRTLASVPIVLVFAAALALVLSVIFFTEVIVNEVYGGPGKTILSFLPIGLFATAVPALVNTWHKVATDLTLWENHPTEVTHERSLTLKMFILNGMVSFGALTLTAYVYLPFGTFLVPKVAGFLRRSVSEDRVSSSSFAAPVGFAANTSRLTNTLFALMTTTQLIGAFNETVLPYLQRKLADYRNEGTATSQPQPHKDAQGKRNMRATTVKGEAEGDWLARIRAEVELPEYSLFSDYSEMAVQFGQVVLFSTAWPLAPLLACLNNFFELRGDAFKLTVNSRRPIPQRADTVGPWIEALSWITYLGALTNASLCYLMRAYTVENPQSTAVQVYTGQSDAPSTTAEAVLAATTASSHVSYKTTRIGSTQGDYASIKSILIGALLCALASEHAFVLIRKGTAHLLDKLLWQGSHEEIALRHRDWELKRDYVENKGGQEFEQEIERLRNKRSEDLDGVDDAWKEEDVGVKEEINRKNV